MTDQTLQTILWTVVMVFAIQALLTYSLVRLFVTGRAMFERRSDHEHDRRDPLVLHR